MMRTGVRQDGVAPVERMGTPRYVAAGAAMAVVLLLVSLTSMAAASVAVLISAVAMAVATRIALRVTRQLRSPGRSVWFGFTAGLCATTAATVITGIAAFTGGERPVPSGLVIWAWAVCGVVVLAGDVYSARVLRPARGWQEMCDALLIVVVVTMVAVYGHGSSPRAALIPDAVEVEVITIVVVAVLSMAFAVGRLIVARGASVGPMGTIYVACLCGALVVIVNVALPVRPAGLGVCAAVTLFSAVLWSAAGHLRLRENRAVQMLLPQSRPAIWRELLPAIVLALLVLAVYFIGDVGSLIGALVAAGIVAARMTLTLVQYRRLLDEEHEQLTAHERTLIEERYARFAMEETQSELVEDNARLRGQERDRLGIVQLLQTAVLRPTEEIRSDLARLIDDPDAASTPVRGRIRRMGGRIDAMHRALDDLLMYSLIVERQLVLTRRPVDVDTLVRQVIRDLSDVIDRTGVALQIDGEARATVHGDAEMLARVLRRVVEAALTASTRSCAVTVLLRSSDDVVVVEVSDRGPGYTDDELPYLCIPFYRPRSGTRDEPGGVGLALANARSIVTMHGGAIRVTSPSRGGLQVRLSLPVYRSNEGRSHVHDERHDDIPDDDPVPLHVTDGGRP